MSIIVSGHIKGGTGKSTIATSFATKIVQSGASAVVVDVDETSTSATWFAIREGEGRTPSVPVVQQLKTPVPVIIELSKKYDAVIVDVGARDIDTLTPLARICDLWIAPLGIGQPDLSATIQLYEEFSRKHSQHKAQRIPLVSVFNKVPSSWNTNEEIDAREFLAEQCPELVILKSYIKDRKAWRDSGRLGLGITEMPAREALKAIEEFDAFFAEALSHHVKH